ncbi:MAG: DUF47 family protein [Bacteroidales bacterium]|nr:DUF47 family protein [Bacteroidales bacterium]
MNIDHFLQLFVVKEKSFFPLFVQTAENIKKASELLIKQTSSADPDERRMLAHRIKEYETEGDAIHAKITQVLIDAYLTPFDREDIHELAEAMDSFLDCMRDSSKLVAIYQPKEPSRKLIQIAEYIDKAAGLMIEITKRFDTIRKDSRVIAAYCDEIKEIEHTVDDIFESYMSNLFEKEPDAKELIKKKNIAQALENTSDVAKVVSSKVRGIVVKNS